MILVTKCSFRGLISIFSTTQKALTVQVSMQSNESEVSPHAFPHFTVYELITEELPKETITYKQSDQPHKKQQIYVVYHHYIYYTYIYLYISLNITKYLLLVHCTKMILKQGTKDESILWANNRSENVSEVREKQCRFSLSC